MSLAIILLSKLVPALSKAVAHRWIGDNNKEVIAAADTLIDVLGTRVKDVPAIKKGAEAFNAIADKVVEELQPIFGESAGLTEGEKEEVAAALADRIAAVDPAGILSREVKGDPTAYESRLRENEREITARFSEAQTTLYHRVLAETALRIVKVADGLPGFTDERLAEVLLDTRALQEKADTILGGLQDLKADVKQIRDRIAPDPAPARLRYLNYLASKTRDLPLRGLDTNAADAQQADSAPCLTDVYITLETMARSETKKGRKEKPSDPQLAAEQVKPVSVLTVFAETCCMVLLGDPGSGKSTLVNYLVYCLAQGQAVPGVTPTFWPADLPEAWRSLLPVRIVLREMVAWLRGNRIEGEKVGLLESYLRRWLTDNFEAEFAGPMMAVIREGKAILLLDGWDEVSNDETALPLLRDMLNELPTVFAGCPMLATCRVRSYAEEPWRLDGRHWPDFTLLALGDDKIDGFVEAWYAQLARRGRVQNWQPMAAKLRTAVHRADLRRMAGNPLLLTIMAIDHAHKGELPDARSKVYEDVVDLLLWKWRQIAKPEEDVSHSLTELLHLAGRQEIDFLRLLWQVAYEAHAGAQQGDDGNRVADVSEYSLLKHFSQLSSPPSLDRASALLRLLQFRSGLLIPSGSDSYTFPHRTFQEYLAACHLCSQGDVVGEALRLAEAGSYWREVILLAVNRLVYQSGDTSRPFALVRRLCPSSTAQSKGESQWRQAALAGECVLEIGLARATGDDADLVARVRDRLVKLVETAGAFAPQERANCGRVLGLLGDPRPGVRIPSEGVPEIEWGKPVEPGDYTIGGDENAYQSLPAERVSLSYPYRLAKYPVTNAQFQAFVDADAAGYNNPAYWTPEGLEWKGARRAPDEAGEGAFCLANHPRVNVCWYEALAF